VSIADDAVYSETETLVNTVYRVSVKMYPWLLLLLAPGAYLIFKI